MISTVLAMTWLEMKLLWRDPGAVVLGLVFPAALLLALGALPGFGEVDPDLGGARLIDLYTPIVLILTFAADPGRPRSRSIATHREPRPMNVPRSSTSTWLPGRPFRG